MSSEIGHTDITDRQLIPTGTTPRKSLSREIGEAEVVHTLFGRARVRIIRKEDTFRRSLWWIVLAVMLAVVAGQVWLIWQEQEASSPEEVLPVIQPEAVSVPSVTDALPPPPLFPPAQQSATPVVPPVVVAPAPVPPANPPQAAVRTIPPVAVAASSVVAPPVPRRVVRPQPAPVATQAASAPAVPDPAADAGTVTGATTATTQPIKPALPTEPQP